MMMMMMMMIERDAEGGSDFGQNFFWRKVVQLRGRQFASATEGSRSEVGGVHVLVRAWAMRMERGYALGWMMDGEGGGQVGGWMRCSGRAGTHDSAQ